MFKVDAKTKTLTEVDETSLTENQLQERDDLQQWIKSNPDLISSHFETDLKIIAEEFDEFDVNDRLDLLAIDNEGTLVVIELKRKDSGSRIDLQGLKYASYCSTIKPARIIEIYEKYIEKNSLNVDARSDLSQFVSTDDGSSDSDLNNLNSEQRIILVAQSFDPRVKSVVAWLGEQGIDISCVQFRVFKDADSGSLYMDSQRILPLQAIDDFLIKDSSISKPKSVGSKKRVPQPDDVIKFLSEYKQIIKSKYDLHARGTDFVKYRTFKAGLRNLEYGFEVMKSQKRYKINLMAQDPSVKLLDAFEAVKSKVTPPTGYDFQFIDPKVDDGKWERIMIFCKPKSDSDYLNDAEALADLTKEFMDSLEPVVRKIKS